MERLFSIEMIFFVMSSRRASIRSGLVMVLVVGMIYDLASYIFLFVVYSCIEQNTTVMSFKRKDTNNLIRTASTFIIMPLYM